MSMKIMNFTDLGLSLCGTESPSFLWFFDLSTPPSLLYYAYIPTIIVSLLVALYVFFKDKKSLRSKLLLSVSIFFALWVINILIQWVASYNAILLSAWQLTAILEIGIFISSFYFSRVFLSSKDITFGEKITMSIVALVVLAIIPTSLNVSGYDFDNCEGINGPLWNIIYAFEPAVIVLMVYLGLDAYRKEKSGNKRKQIALFTIGNALFLTLFFLSNFYGELTKVYEFNLWGPVGMVSFLVLLGYMIVRFHAFNVKVFATQALVIGISSLIGAQLFFLNDFLDVVVTVATLVAFLISGLFLIRSVKREIEAREQIEKLAGDLQTANEGQANLIHIINHQIKSYMTKARYIYDALLHDSDYGSISETARHMIEKGYKEVTEGVKFVQNFLAVSDIEKGTFVYDMQPIDFKKIVTEVAEEQKETAKNKNLSFDFSAADADYSMKGDASQLSQAVRNLIDNSIKYTSSGGLDLNLERKADKILLAVKDTGVGISDELKPKLFTKGAMGKDSTKINVNSTGFGLSFVKGVVEAHKGRVWADSPGPNLGSTFYMELPMNS